MMELPEAHYAVEVSPKKWMWPICIPFTVNGQQVFCADVFRASGATFVRVVPMKHLGEFEARRYTEGTYLTAAEWAENEA